MGVNVSISGISQTIRGVYTNSNGWLPGVAVVDVLPGALAIDSVVDLAFTDGYQSVTIPACRVVRVEEGFDVDRRDVFQRLTLLDRRWRWMGNGQITGTYNIRKNNGTFETGSERTPRQLMALIFDALGEAAYDVSLVPNVSRPFVSWDLSLPAVMGNRILRELGCDVSYDVVTNSFRVYPIGQGAVPSFSEVVNPTNSVVLANIPYSVTAYSGHASFQEKWKLKPLAEETDGELVAAADVSYAPAGGWTDEDDPENLLAGGDPSDQAAANRSVFRVFQIEEMPDDTLNLPAYGATIPSYEYGLPLLKYLNTGLYETDAGLEFRGGPWVEGVFLPPMDIPGLENTDVGTLVEVPFRIDRGKGLVIFSRPVWKLGDAGGIDFPDLYLMTSHKIRDSKYSYYRYAVTRLLGGPASPTHPVIFEDLVPQYTATYDPGNPLTVTGTTDNETAIATELNRRLDDYVQRFQGFTAREVICNGIGQYVNNGLVRSVSWVADCEKLVVQTVTSMNTETALGMPKPAERDQKLESWADGRARSMQQMEEFQRRTGRVM
jgi:hypothetical protein